MEKIKLNGHIVHVDVKRNRELYTELPLFSDKEHCGCEDCAYFEKAVMQASPEVLSVFEQLGVDPRKEAEVWRAAENDDGTFYYICDYHLVGEIVGVAELDWIDVEEASFGLSNFTGTLPHSMIPESFPLPIIWMMVKITVRGDVG